VFLRLQLEHAKIGHYAMLLQLLAENQWVEGCEKKNFMVGREIGCWEG
jgi:hypothetical protein